MAQAEESAWLGPRGPTQQDVDECRLRVEKLDYDYKLLEAKLGLIEDVHKRIAHVEQNSMRSESTSKQAIEEFKLHVAKCMDRMANMDEEASNYKRTVGYLQGRVDQCSESMTQFKSAANKDISDVKLAVQKQMTQLGVELYDCDQKQKFTEH